jgi:hypothetical protein
MARKLKTYQTSLGFFDLAIAAPSRIIQPGESSRPRCYEITKDHLGTNHMGQL